MSPCAVRAASESSPTVEASPIAAEQPSAASSESAPLATLNDEALSDVRAGEFALSLEGFDVAIQNNEAGLFTFDIAQNAFNNARGIFTTLQTVNSAVDLTLIVNIFLNTLPSSS